MVSGSADSPRQIIVAPRLFDGEAMQGGRAVEIAGGRIVALHVPADAPRDVPVVTLPSDSILAPGFIDVQVNGGGGVLLNDDPSPEAIARIAAAHRAFGTTGMLPTLITDTPDKMQALLANADSALAIPGILGFHLEGPFINARRKGIHPEHRIRSLTADDIETLTRFGMRGHSMATLAPECLAGDQIQALAASRLLLSIGHSDATGEDMHRAIATGFTGVTHLFNAMSQMTPREPGVVGAALATDSLFAGIICDGRHVSPDNLRVAFRAKGRDRLMLVTDAMALVGSSRTDFHLGDRHIVLKDGQLTDEGGTLAGAHLTMFDAVRNAQSMMGATLEDALVMASRTPARFLGLGDERGAIRSGFRADLVAFTAHRVVLTWIDGVPAAG